MENNLPFEFLTEAEFEAFIERVGICQHEGNLSFEEAQIVAYDDVVKSRVGLETSVNLNYSSNVKLISAKDLQQKYIPPLNWIVPSIIAEGATILVSKPKLGKSWLCINLALSVAMGVKVLNKYDTIRSNVLYIVLDDTQRRLQSRINLVLQSDSYPDSEAPSNLFLTEDMEFPKLNINGLEVLEKIVDDHQIKLVIVDTFALSIEKHKGSSEYSYQLNYELVSKLKEFANKKHLCLLLVHHAKKESGEDVFDDILGSTGIAAAVDTMMNLKKYKSGFKLHFTGKDVISDDLDLEFDIDKHIWKVMDELHSINTTPERMEIIKLLTKEGKEMKTEEFAEKLGKSKSNTSNILRKMTIEGLIKNTKFGFYTLSNTIISNSESDVSSESDGNSVSDESNES